MTWWRPWRNKEELERAQEAIRRAERLRDAAREQQCRAETLVPRVAATSSRLERLSHDNHFGPLMDRILRGGGE